MGDHIVDLVTTLGLGRVVAGVSHLFFAEVRSQLISPSTDTGLFVLVVVIHLGTVEAVGADKAARVVWEAPSVGDLLEGGVGFVGTVLVREEGNTNIASISGTSRPNVVSLLGILLDFIVFVVLVTVVVLVSVVRVPLVTLLPFLVSVLGLVLTALSKFITTLFDVVSLIFKEGVNVSLETDNEVSVSRGAPLSALAVAVLLGTETKDNRVGFISVFSVDGLSSVTGDQLETVLVEEGAIVHIPLILLTFLSFLLLVLLIPIVFFLQTTSTSKELGGSLGVVDVSRNRGS